jgi:hypothetical protein
MIYSSTPADTRPWFHRGPFVQSASRACQHPDCVVIYAPRPALRERSHEANPILLEVRWSDWSVSDWHEFFEQDGSFARFADGPQRDHALAVLTRWLSVFGAGDAVSTPRFSQRQPSLS